MIQFVVGATAGYVFGTKAGRKRYHQIKDAYEKAINSQVTKSMTRFARKAIADRLDPDPRMREVKDLSARKKHPNQVDGSDVETDRSTDRIYEHDED